MSANPTRPARRGRFGLRGRLIVVVILTAILGAVAAGWSGVYQSADSMVDLTTRTATDDFVTRITGVAPTVEYPPDSRSLEILRDAAGEHALATSGSMSAGSGLFAAGAAALRTDLDAQVAAGRGHVITQRASIDGALWLVIAAPVMITQPDGDRVPSGIVVSSARSLAPVQDQVSSLISRAAWTTLLVLPLAVLLALVSSRSVLLPVARLQHTTRRLAAGDLTARAKPQGADELAQLTRTVNEMAASLQDAMSTMWAMEEDARRFAADVSHELRTPLTTLAATVEVLSDVLSGDASTSAVDEDEARESAQLAVIETRRLIDLVEGIMETARLDAGTVALRRESTELVPLIHACAAARGWADTIRIEGAPSPVTVYADRRRIDVIMANLIGNGLTHGRPPVRITVAREGDDVVVEVADSGAGIPDDMLPHVFARFSKADATRARTPGTGLGLAIAQEYARLHGGEITAANQPEGGAVFTLRLPVGAPVPHEEGERP